MCNANENLLELQAARVVRDGAAILDLEWLVLRADEHVAILGPNGAGKSTLVKLLTRDVRALAADPAPVLLFGRERWDLFEARSLLGIVSDELQDRYMRDVTVTAAVLSGFFGSVGLYRHHRVTRAMREQTACLLQELGIAPLAERSMQTLSTGEARRALIARALVHDPRVLVLDEPCAGLDPAAAYHFRNTMSELARSGRALVLVTHHVDDIIPEVERVVMLKDGRLFADGPKSEMMTSERMGGLYGVPAHLEERGGVYRMW
jgi:iron complex transport system ATP-binding protein